VGSSIDRTVQSANSSIQLLSWPSMFCIRHSYTQLQRWLHCAPCCKHCMLSLCVLHALSMPVCMQSKSSLSRGSCLSTCSQCVASEDSERVSLQPLVDGLSCRLHLAAVTCTVHSVFAEWTQQTHHLECCTHLHTVACCLIVWHPANVVAVFSQQHMSLELPGNTANLPMLHIMNSTRHAAHRHTQPHACMYANATVPDSEQQMSQRYARVPSFYVNFTHMPAATRSVVSALCPCALPSMYISHTWLRQQLQKALACCGLGLAAV
jgi:hypothetical protein